jgi:hypothetical protein
LTHKFHSKKVEGIFEVEVFLMEFVLNRKVIKYGPAFSFSVAKVYKNFANKKNKHGERLIQISMSTPKFEGRCTRLKSPFWSNKCRELPVGTARTNKATSVLHASI